MRILTVSSYFDDHLGGIEIVAGALAAAFADAGHESRWAACGIDKNGEVQRIGLASLDAAEKNFGLPIPLPGPRSLRRLDRAIAECDALIVHDALYAPSLAAIASAKVRRIPIILVQHIGVVPFRSRVLKGVMAVANRLVVRSVMRVADRTVFISDTVRRHFSSVRFSKPPVTIFNGVDHDLFRPPSSEERAAARQRFGITDERPAIVFAGRFVFKKGLSVLREVANRRGDADILLAGSGTIDPTDWGLPNVRVLGRLERPSMAQLFQAADVLLLPSDGEGFPLVLQEAMATGLPIICGLDSAAADPEASRFLHGVSIDLANPERTTDGVLAALDEIELSVRATGGSAHARRCYKWASSASAILALLPFGDE